MRSIVVERDIAAPKSAVWSVLADYPNISSWNSGVKKSYATSEATSGVGAQRHCDLSPAGGLEETIREWSPEDRLVISIDKASKVPIKDGKATFELGDGDGSTPLTLTYDYTPKGGPFASIIGRVMEGQLRKGFVGFLEDLEAAAIAR